ncbi:sensor histidine kinase [Ruminococcus sp.]|uniref:sensor histidine kinase n=1 Tax=Ruminococcus sp. TaxID=41978 RepID=UPI0025CE27D6|nr:sensor histidine kinase [Ruminococcus sp.]
MMKNTNENSAYDRNKRSAAGLVKGYLAQYRSFAIMLIVFAAVFGAVLYLYNENTEAVLYAFGICAAIGAVVLAIGFVNFALKYRKLAQIYDNISITAEDFPEAKSPVEAEYIAMIEKLCAINRDSITAYQTERSEALDYYTTWVHQIKTPISVMQMILQREDTDEHRELSAELFRVEQYAEMALSYVRLDSDSRDLVIKDLDLDSVIRKSIRRYAAQFIRRKLVLKYSGTEVKVLSDEKWLAFIIEQLLSNAVKYTESGSVEISVSGEVLAIKDTGIGIASEDIPRIFEKGFTGYNGRENSKSTGLGLYLCKKSAQMLGHKIWAQSETGQGSTFFVDLHRDKLEVE